MLDYLLVQPESQKLWRYNQPDTLRYIIVDEFHTFDGAQGTESRLPTPPPQAPPQNTTPAPRLCRHLSYPWQRQQQIRHVLRYAETISKNPSTTVP